MKWLGLTKTGTEREEQMRRFETLKVMYHDRLVGQLTMGINDTCLFQYCNEWLHTGFSISPLKLPLKGDLFEALIYRSMVTSVSLKIVCLEDMESMYYKKN